MSESTETQDNDRQNQGEQFDVSLLHINIKYIGLKLIFRPKYHFFTGPAGIS